ncbi:MAG: DUF4366 domain-containing protein [Ruminococcaceae bacterium]|nr:DUF4366 domain-containing protein [Oscillospiraceae bacterium]
MKKHILKITCAFLAIMAATVLALPVFAEETSGHNAIDLLNTDLSPYIKLGKYQNLDVTVNVGVTDEDLYEMAVKNGVYAEVKSRNTAAGDILSISYVGNIVTSTGKPIPVRGGTGSGTVTQGKTSGDKLLDLLSVSDKLVGITPGKTADVKVTVPENYEETAMAGREVVFTVTVKSIIEYGYTEEHVKSQYGCESLEDFKLLVAKSSLQNFDQLVLSEIYLTIAANATLISYPQDHVLYYYESQYNYLLSYYESNPQYAATYGSFETFLAYNGISLDDIEEYAKVQTERDLVCFALYKTGALGTISETEYATMLAEQAANSGMTVEAFETMYAGKHDISNLIIGDYVYARLGRLANLTTDYADYKYLLEAEALTSQNGVTTTAPGEENEKIDPNIIVMIVIIAVGVVGIITLFVVKAVIKNKTVEESDEYDDYDDQEDEDDYDEEDEEDEE